MKVKKIKIHRYCDELLDVNYCLGEASDGHIMLAIKPINSPYQTLYGPFACMEDAHHMLEDIRQAWFEMVDRYKFHLLLHTPGRFHTHGILPRALFDPDYPEIF